ncbi:FHA domain-containing protein [Crateriforma conspicua]|uniref:FHA domain-containing protein FhaA n=1 Tax=Crateriforma conspicua TaxID=2527996 RepID=A0A5C5Y723_9PLAN|nr:FHA domain-containing protein [Crateriforma conspicua]QDV65700.1 FHA domain-containing protein FhaA [Crateriforma conspicua]TWT71100.1 FHA domain-containing protein FhaA [Crateriforma conspicua]
MFVQLILAQGSRAGLTADIAHGYYMIGRHAECQIRPKSKSVSRRHCLIHHGAESVRVLDLNSTSGTRLNNEKLPPLQWTQLSDGDQLRCGKVAFDLAVAATTPASGTRATGTPATGTPADDDSGDGPADTPTMIQGEAWQEFDIAAFLEKQDDADRERRYENIRSRVAAGEEAASDDGDERSLDIDSVDVDWDDSDSMDVSIGQSDTAVKEPTGRPSAASRSPDRKPSESPFAGSKKRRASKADTDWVETAKMVGAIVLAILVVALVIYQIVQFQSPPDLQVIDGID